MEPRIALATHIGQGVRAARNKLNLTQADVAERVGLATEVYGRLERGHMCPSVSTLVRLCSVLQCSADELLGLPSGDRPLSTVEPPAPPAESRELRRLVRSLRELDARGLRLLGQVAGALKH